MVTAIDVLAANNFGDTRTGGLAGPLGLLITVLLGIATVMLIRNMNARLRRLPDSFPGQEDTPDSDSSPHRDSPESPPTGAPGSPPSRGESA